MKHKRAIPKAYQQAAIESGVAVFSECHRLLDIAGDNASQRAIAIKHHGVLLLEAPTGSGKTLIAGHIVERLAAIANVVWFWFAPFKGIVGQTVNSLGSEYGGLRLRELTADRNASESRSGDVWVTTWQTVATKVRDKRNVHIRAELNLTVEELIDALREQQFRIGVVVDEAHHGFFGSSGSETQSMRIFREMLKPDFSLFVTATPDDKDIERYRKHLGLEELKRVTISRAEPVQEGLIKQGIKCVAYLAPDEQSALVDFEQTALRDAVATHNEIKATLRKSGSTVVPLLLVQVDSKGTSVDRAREHLLRLGFSESQIAVHTAEEPDAQLLSLANDESREVLIFKMAVALGFDAPRAFCLASMRSARDEDYGVQLVGRILRVDRRLQSKARENKLPDILRFGYVFLAIAESQTGLDLAGQRINQMRTAYASVSNTIHLYHSSSGKLYLNETQPDGQSTLFTLLGDLHSVSASQPPPPYKQDADGNPALNLGNDPSPPLPQPNIPNLFFPTGSSKNSDPQSAPSRPAASPVRSFSYKLKPAIPRHLKTHIADTGSEASEEDCARHFILSSADLLRAIAGSIKLEKKTLEVFTSQLEINFFSQEIDPNYAARYATKIIYENEDYNPRTLKKALLAKLSQTLAEEGFVNAHNLEHVNHLLNVILISKPDLLYTAQKKASSASTIIVDTEEPLPESIVSDSPLPSSTLNAYGVIPLGINQWEKDFVDILDANHESINWWHRNPDRKPYSIQVVLDNGKHFYPDFIVSVKNRKTEDGGLLVDPKFLFETSAELPKTKARHPAYGNVLILTKTDARWMTVRYEPKHDKAVADTPFRISDMPGY